jgi:hypothetical protein
MHSQDRLRALRIIARTLYRQLESQGYDFNHVIALSSELLHLVSQQVRTRQARNRPPDDTSLAKQASG